MFKNLKGYLRRLRTIKKDKTIQVDMPVYGEFEANLIHSCILNGDGKYSNIIIRLDYEKNKESMINIANELTTLLNICDIKYIPVSINDIYTFIYIAGNIYSYNKLISLYYYNPKYRYNKLLCMIKNLLDRIDITKNISEDNKELTIYTSETKYINSNQMYIQNVSDTVSPDIIDEIYPLLMIGMCNETDNGYDISVYDVVDFLFIYYTMDCPFSTTIYNYRNSLILNGKKYKNIFDITFKVNNQDSSGYNEDIDEIID